LSFPASLVNPADHTGTNAETIARAYQNLQID
jgi:DNA-binding transcriptional regulator YhcF (GntR family)